MNAPATAPIAIPALAPVERSEDWGSDVVVEENVLTLNMGTLFATLEIDIDVDADDAEVVFVYTQLASLQLDPGWLCPYHERP